MDESKIEYEGINFYVYQISRYKFEIRKKTFTHSYVVGSGNDLEKVIRTAKRLEKYPDNV